MSIGISEDSQPSELATLSFYHGNSAGTWKSGGVVEQMAKKVERNPSLSQICRKFDLLAPCVVQQDGPTLSSYYVSGVVE